MYLFRTLFLGSLVRQQVYQTTLRIDKNVFIYSYGSTLISSSSFQYDCTHYWILKASSSVLLLLIFLSSTKLVLALLIFVKYVVGIVPSIGFPYWYVGYPGCVDLQCTFWPRNKTKKQLFCCHFTSWDQRPISTMQHPTKIKILVGSQEKLLISCNFESGFVDWFTK